LPRKIARGRGASANLKIGVLEQESDGGGEKTQEDTKILGSLKDKLSFF
jgi:hypothetical protein